MSHENDIWGRRNFLKMGAGSTAAVCLGLGMPHPLFAQDPQPLKFDLSLAEWSLHQMLFDQKLDNLDFPGYAKDQFGIDAVEYVNQFFKDKADDAKYLAELKDRCNSEGVTSVLIMIDAEGDLGDADPKQRRQAVENHYQWVEAAKSLGCHSIRVNARSTGSYEQQQSRAAEGLRSLCEFAAQHGINVIVENHGGLSSNGKWLAGVMERVAMPNCGTLPDFGNFRIDDQTEYDRYQGVAELMPFARAVSAKSHDFDEEGNEIHTDYRRMMQIVTAAGYHGRVGIEYEGQKVDEPTGVRLTRDLLLRIRDEMIA